MLPLIPRHAALVAKHPAYYHLDTLRQALQTLAAEGNDLDAARIKREIDARKRLLDVA